MSYCASCKHYEGPAPGDVQRGYLHGYCQKINSDSLKERAYTEEYDCGETCLRVMEEFGCILHEEKSNG